MEKTIGDEPATTPETPVKPEEKKGDGILAKLFGGKAPFWAASSKSSVSAASCTNSGGRKTVAGGGALTFMSQVVTTDMGDWAKVDCCAGASVVSGALMIAIEDKGKNGGK